MFNGHRRLSLGLTSDVHVTHVARLCRVPDPKRTKSTLQSLKTVIVDGHSV
jgi:hypothetical protein